MSGCPFFFFRGAVGVTPPRSKAAFIACLRRAPARVLARRPSGVSSTPPRAGFVRRLDVAVAGLVPGEPLGAQKTSGRACPIWRAMVFQRSSVALGPGSPCGSSSHRDRRARRAGRTDGADFIAHDSTEVVASGILLGGAVGGLGRLDPTAPRFGAHDRARLQTVRVRLCERDRSPARHGARRVQAERGLGLRCPGASAVHRHPGGQWLRRCSDGAGRTAREVPLEALFERLGCEPGDFPDRVAGFVPSGRSVRCGGRRQGATSPGLSTAWRWEPPARN